MSANSDKLPNMPSPALHAVSRVARLCGARKVPYAHAAVRSRQVIANLDMSNSFFAEPSALS